VIVNPADWEILQRVLLAGLLGYLVGIEREYIAHREAGTSTFGMIAMSAALVTAVSLNLFGSDPASRVVANILVGVGFIGGGTILKETGHIKGLTTAAGIWAMASVGMVIGAGQYAVGIAASLVVLALFGLGHVEDFILQRLRQSRDQTPGR
jgi:putative Mg2+ transporter-C (MgtC) family protein